MESDDNHSCHSCTKLANEDHKSPELPQGSSEDTVLILKELRKINSAVETLSNRLSKTEKNLSSLKIKMVKGKSKKITKKGIEVSLDVRVSIYIVYGNSIHDQSLA